ncbi:MAG: hypothetical protein HQK77_12075 [Desulfobacterales bacterium]|nr:hypothetical protein [Desulfobacterales bacterium]
MPSDIHLELYSKIIEQSNRILVALESNEFEHIDQWIEEQSCLVNELNAVGFTENMSHVELVQKANEHVNMTISKLREYLKKTDNQLTAIGNRDKIDKAYGRWRYL